MSRSEAESAEKVADSAQSAPRRLSQQKQLLTQPLLDAESAARGLSQHTELLTQQLLAVESAERRLSEQKNS